MNDEQPLEKPATLAQLEESWQVVEKPFVSTAPFIGPILVWLRTTWNNVATKWYVRAILQQQNEFNRLAVRHQEYLQERFWEMDRRLIDQDRDQSVLSHNLAELSAGLNQMNRLLQSIDERLARLEGRQ
jgi:hypothetical protein